MRDQRTDFPGEPDEGLFERARGLGSAAIERGFREVAASGTRIPHPGDEGVTIDTWCEVVFEKPVGDLERALDEVRFALSLDRSATPG